jgi:predicted transcriptional regulator
LEVQKMIVEVKIVSNDFERTEEIRKIESYVKKGGVLTKKIIILTPELFVKIFSPERIRMIKFMNKEKSGSISELAGKIGRKFEAVHRDLKLFENYGLVKMTEEGKNMIPTLVGQIRVPAIA